MLSWLIGGHVKKEIKDHIHNLHLHLSHSFTNIKDDISNIHLHLSQKDKKMAELEGKLILLENKIMYSLQLKEGPMQIETKKEEIIELERESSMAELTSFTYTQQAILKALCELQEQLNSPISFKSLAKYLYPGKKYGAVRTTLSEYIDTLSTYGLVTKNKIGRETVANITKKGQTLAKDLLKKDKQKKKIRIESD
jgi:hypothetical protein